MNPAVVAVIIICAGMAAVLWLAHLSEKQGINARPWRLFWTVFLIAAAFAVYVVLVNAKQ